MASELYVETLKGLTSGANANKVIVPAGQTLDASAGTVVPSAGQVVQCQFSGQLGQYVYNPASAGTWYAGPSINFTPNHVDSKILLQWTGNPLIDGNDCYIILRLEYSTDGGSTYTDVKENGVNSSETGSFGFGTYLGAAEGSRTMQMATYQWYLYPTENTNQHIFRIQSKITGRGQPYYLHIGNPGHRMTIWEIAG